MCCRMGGGGGSLVERGGIFWKGAEIPSSTQVDCGVCGRFFSAGSCELAILATQSHAQVMPPCDCVANSVRLAVEYREIVAMGVNFGLMALSEISARGGAFGFGPLSKRASPDFCIRGTKRVFFFRGGNSPVQPLMMDGVVLRPPRGHTYVSKAYNNQLLYMRGVYIVKSIIYYVYYYFYGLFYNDASTNRRTCSEPEVMVVPPMQSTGGDHHRT
jgi:hypothetical protein